MAESNSLPLMVMLTDESSGGRISVSLEGFVAFTEWLFADLDRLEERWLPTSAPVDKKATQRSRVVRRSA